MSGPWPWLADGDIERAVTHALQREGWVVVKRHRLDALKDKNARLTEALETERARLARFAEAADFYVRYLEGHVSISTEEYWPHNDVYHFAKRDLADDQPEDGAG